MYSYNIAKKRGKLTWYKSICNKQNIQVVDKCRNNESCRTYKGSKYSCIPAVKLLNKETSQKTCNCPH